MGKFLISMITVLTSLTAIAGMGPETQFLGSYKVVSCAHTSLKDAEKVWVQVRKNPYNKTESLDFRGYTPDGMSDLDVRLGSGSTPFMGADGTETWKSKFVGTELVVEFSFDRKGSKTWPDLGYTRTTTLKWDAASETVTILDVTKGNYGHNPRGMDSNMSCVLSSLAKDPAQIAPMTVEVLNNKELEALQPDFGTGDFDQATANVTRFSFNIKDPNEDQIKEALSLETFAQWPTYKDIEITKFTKASKGQSFANRGFATAISIAKDMVKDAENDAEQEHLEKSYAQFYAYINRVAKYLDAKPANIKVYLLKWSASDSDGNGLLLIDTNTGEAIYIGASYWS